MIERGGRSAPVAWLVGLAALAAGGCDSGDARQVADADGDGGIDADDDGDAGGDGEEGLEDGALGEDADGSESDGGPVGCPAPIAASCPPDTGIPSELRVPDPVVLLRASELGAGVHFVNVAEGPVFLAERSDASGRAILVHELVDGGLPADGELALPAGSTLRAVAVARSGADSSLTYLPRIVVLACDGDACALYGADLAEGETTSLAAIPGGEIPAARELRGLWWEEGPAACAYGDGVDCYDGVSWTSPLLPPTTSAPLVDAATCGWITKMVGAEGLTASSAWPHWNVSSGAIYADLLAVACTESEWLRAGEGGIIRSDDSPECPVAEEAIAFLAMDRYNRWGLAGATASGRVFVGELPFGPTSRLCYTGQSVGPLVAASAGFCGIVFNYLLVTADTVYGSYDCAID
jgi:hypothetical protein